MTSSQRPDFSDFAAMLQTTMHPLTTKLQTLEDKVDRLSQDRVTRTDIEKLRAELVGSMVPRDAYEPRHLALVERMATLEAGIREERKDRLEDNKGVRDDVEQDLQRLYERMESGKAQIEQRFKDQQEMTLSGKDRLWIRWNQVVGLLGILIALIDLIVQHVGLH